MSTMRVGRSSLLFPMLLQLWKGWSVFRATTTWASPRLFSVCYPNECHTHSNSPLLSCTRGPHVALKQAACKQMTSSFVTKLPLCVLTCGRGVNFTLGVNSRALQWNHLFILPWKFYGCLLPGFHWALWLWQWRVHRFTPSWVLLYLWLE